MSSAAVVSRLEGDVLHLLLDRVEKANAYTTEMLDQLEAAIEDADLREAVRLVVIRGAGERTFCAGADLGEIEARDWKSVLELKSARVFERIRRARCVTLAVVNGAAVGGGMELAAACDLRIAVGSARFRLPEPEIGLLPAAGGLSRIPSLVGTAHARALILGGAEWSAEDALRAGFVSEVVSEVERLDEVVAIWVARIVARDPDAIRLAKQALELESSSPAADHFALLAQALLERRSDT